MATDRRGFLGAAVGLAGLNAAKIPGIARAASRAGADPDRAAGDEDFWWSVRDAFRLDRRFIDLQGNSVSPAPRAVQEALFQYLETANSLPSYHLYHLDLTMRDRVRARLARLLNVSAGEVALTRNTTEAMNIAIRGIDLSPGDEVLTTTDDFPAMIRSWEQRERREGIVLRQVEIPGRPGGPGEVVAAFERALSPRTRVLMACHVIFRTGQIYPIDRICAMARDRGIRTLIDGAHGFGHVPCDLKAIGCDYYGTSLHKWIGAPIGTGFLYVRRDRIAGLWPLHEPYSGDVPADRIEKLEAVGTAPPTVAAVTPALDLFEAIGPDRKRARLHSLKRLWVDRIEGLPGVRILTNPGPEDSCAFASFAIDGVEPARIFRHLLDDHRILIGPGGEGNTVAAQVYTSVEDVLEFARVIERVARDGLPS